MNWPGDMGVPGPLSQPSRRAAGVVRVLPRRAWRLLWLQRPHHRRKGALKAIRRIVLGMVRLVGPVMRERRRLVDSGITTELEARHGLLGWAVNHIVVTENPYGARSRLLQEPVPDPSLVAVLSLYWASNNAGDIRGC